MKKSTLVLLSFSLLFGAQVVASVDCWELTDKDGHKVMASDVWHIKNRLGQNGALMGKLDGEDTAIPVADISSMTLAPGEKAWMPFMSAHSMKGEITFTDGRKVRFESDLGLHFIKDDKRSSMPLADVRSIIRCDAETSAGMVGGEQENTTAPAPTRQPVAGNTDSVRMANGDVLYGAITTMDFNWKAPYASLTFKRGQIQTITLGESKKGNGLLELRSGDRISGALANKYVEITLKYGQRVPLAAETLKSIHFRKAEH